MWLKVHVITILRRNNIFLGAHDTIIIAQCSLHSTSMIVINTLIGQIVLAGVVSGGV